MNVYTLNDKIKQYKTLPPKIVVNIDAKHAND